jgi:hypothetical protein
MGSLTNSLHDWLTRGNEMNKRHRNAKKTAQQSAAKEERLNVAPARVAEPNPCEFRGRRCPKNTVAKGLSEATLSQMALELVRQFAEVTAQRHRDNLPAVYPTLRLLNSRAREIQIAMRKRYGTRKFRAA